jgi:hypothetical protein
MPTESNTSSDLGPNARHKHTPTPVKCFDGKGEVRLLIPIETPKERMARVVKNIREKKR